MQRKNQIGFTLLEMAMVLTIIGLLVGGVLVGQDLIRAAGVKATITQIQKYQAAVGTFQEKFGALPGDIPAQLASKYGFTARGTLPGEGDGDNQIMAQNGEGSICMCQGLGESTMVWVDLTSANGLNLNLIEGSFSAASPTVVPPNDWSTATSPTNIGMYLPVAKIGRGNNISVYSNNGNNYFDLVIPQDLRMQNVTMGLTVYEAYNIDQKMDDGSPQTGNVTAQYVTGASPYTTATLIGAINTTAPPLADTVTGPSSEVGCTAVNEGTASSPDWVNIDCTTDPGTTTTTYVPATAPLTTAATPGSPYTCYDNNNVAGATQHYSTEQQNGSNLNCALSFQFQ